MSSLNKISLAQTKFNKNLTIYNKDKHKVDYFLAGPNKEVDMAANANKAKEVHMILVIFFFKNVML